MQKRIEWLDSIKGLAILAVVLGHVLVGFNENYYFSDTTPLSVQTWIYSWHMPLFFFLSGFSFWIAFLRTGEKKKEKLHINALNIIAIFFIFQMLLCLFKMSLSNFVDNKLTLMDTLRNLMLPETIMWYMWVLFIYYMIGYLLPERIICSKWLLAMSGVISVAGAYAAKAFFFPLCIRNLFYCFFFFLGGLYLASNSLPKRAMQIISAVSLVYLVGFCVLRYVFSVDTAILEFLNALCMIAITYTAFQYLPYIGTTKCFLNGLGKRSLVIYLMHTYFVTMCKVVFMRLHLALPPIVVILASLFISIAITLMISILVDRVQWIGAIFNPMKHYYARKNKS